jgi:hypothetical protein
MPQGIDGKMQLAQILAKSGLVPSGLKTAEQVFVALEWGHELGLSPMVAINSIAIINGRPTMSADIMHSLARRCPEYGGATWTRQDAHAAEVVLVRKSDGFTEKYTGYFDIDMARKAGLTGKDVWVKYPARMLKHRALGYALRDAFPDVLAGIYTPEEMNGAERDVTEPTRSPVIAGYTQAAVAPEPPPPPPSKMDAERDVTEPPPPPPPSERTALIAAITIDIQTNAPNGKPYFADPEVVTWRKRIRDLQPGEAAVPALRFIAKAIHERLDNLKAAMPLEGASTPGANTAALAMYNTDDDADTDDAAPTDDDDEAKAAAEYEAEYEAEYAAATAF